MIAFCGGGTIVTNLWVKVNQTDRFDVIDTRIAGHSSIFIFDGTLIAVDGQLCLVGNLWLIGIKVGRELHNRFRQHIHITMSADFHLQGDDIISLGRLVVERRLYGKLSHSARESCGLRGKRFHMDSDSLGTNCMFVIDLTRTAIHKLFKGIDILQTTDSRHFKRHSRYLKTARFLWEEQVLLPFQRDISPTVYQLVRHADLCARIVHAVHNEVLQFTQVTRDIRRCRAGV